MPLTNYTFQQLIDFTRTTSGTFVGSNGLIQNTPQSRNLLTWTQEFDNAAWAKTNATVTANSTTAPDGTLTADTLVENTANTQHQTLRSATLTASTHVWSVYAKQGPGVKRWLSMYPQGAGVAAVAVFDLTLGAVSFSGLAQFLSASITAVGNGWYRCAIVFTGAAVSVNCVSYLSNTATGTAPIYTGDGTSGLFLWGAQLEAAAAATDYTRNVGGLFPARFDYDPVTLAPRGILIEEQRTNLLTYSEQFDNAAWSKQVTTVTADAATSPDGTANADKLIPTAVSSQQHHINRGATVAASTVYTITCYVKAGEYSGFYLRDGFTGFNVVFNLATGTVGATAGATGTISAVGNGWFRCSATMTSSGTSFRTDIGVLQDGTQAVSTVYTGDGTSGVFIWGAQLEAGSFATSYIPTVASQVTRTADQASIVAPMFAPWYNQSEGTFVVEADTFKPTTLATSAEALSANDGTSANRAVVRFLTANVEGLNVTGGAVVVQIIQAYSANGVEKLAFAIKANDFAFARNGSLVGSDTSGAMPVSVDRLSIGGPSPVNGHIRRITFYPVRLTNAQLEALTA